ncbi:MAG: L-seryl-tRNA(Sec) selenium transferase [Syntrophobacterales bacterium]|nr:L-seryl-tRNA(Sec) selenium transferase [Syntrophobacterales bacterium]
MGKIESNIQKRLRELPSVHAILEHPMIASLGPRYPRKVVIESVRKVLDRKRRIILEGIVEESIDEKDILGEIVDTIQKALTSTLRPVVNATGIIVHTNLGRSILPEEAIESMVQVARSYSSLEYDLETGKRGSRYVHTERLLREVTGAEGALVVNNNAAAVFLVLNTLARGKEVIISRGELVEIGGSFRMPEVMAMSGAVLREVGCTNRTHLIDYEQAIGDSTVALMKVHKSNYRIIGFTHEVGARELVELAHRRGILALEDMGSGCFVDLSRFGLHGEPTVKGELEEGMDIVTFSGDKLLGGPQAGIIVGRKELIEKLKRNPLTRALRVDKLTLSALEATLRLYYDEDRALEYVPTLKMIAMPLDELKKRAEGLKEKLKVLVEDRSLEISVIPSKARTGGGSLPEVDIPSWAVSVKHQKVAPQMIEEFLRKFNPPIIARIEEDRLLLDVRTLQKGDDEIILEAFTRWTKVRL